jgi:hypothetical protein
MSFYAFRLDQIHAGNPRGQIPDNDVVTFSVLVNQIDRGHGAGFFPDLAAGSNCPAVAVTANTRNGMSKNWIVGPLEIALGDTVLVVYSGTNTSDSEVDLSGQGTIEIKILDSITSAAIGAIGGAVASAVTTVLGLIGDPVGKFLGYSAPVPCNGVVFSDAVSFSGSGLDSLAFHPNDTPYVVGFLPGSGESGEFSFTRSYTDEATHNAGCGEVAHYDVTFSVLKVTSISVRSYLRWLFPGAWKDGVLVPDFSQGLRQLAAPHAAVSVKGLLGLRP